MGKKTMKFSGSNKTSKGGKSIQKKLTKAESISESSSF